MDRSFFRGKLRLQRLPRTRIGSGRVHTGRIATPRGELAVILNGPPVRYVAIVEFARGVTRGNHMHRRKDQWLYLVRGALVGRFRGPGNGSDVRFRVAPGDLVYIGSGIAHAFTAVLPSLALEACAKIYDPLDTVRVELVPTR